MQRAVQKELGKSAEKKVVKPHAVVLDFWQVFSGYLGISMGFPYWAIKNP